MIESVHAAAMIVSTPKRIVQNLEENSFRVIENRFRGYYSGRQWSKVFVGFYPNEFVVINLNMAILAASWALGLL